VAKHRMAPAKECREAVAAAARVGAAAPTRETKATNASPQRRTQFCLSSLLGAQNASPYGLPVGRHCIVLQYFMVTHFRFGCHCWR
jgi:hypothetical protein